MQKNDKFYTFLFSSSRSNNLNNLSEVRVSKRLVHGSIVGIYLCVGITALVLGINGVLKNAGFEPIEKESGILARVSAQQPVSKETIDYSRPQGSVNYAFSMGGPDTAETSNGEGTELDKQLRIIKTTVDPTFVPAIWAHVGKINNEFGFRRNPFGGRTYEFHSGMDIDGERGDLVIAPANGTIVKAGYEGGYGYMVEIDHGNGLTTRYGHLAKVNVENGTPVTRGQLIGFVGSTGRSTGPHLHYEVRINDRPINPRHFLPQEPMQLAKR
jgi:murein DD-endopeptidase MepM/ murein hydrolase activator NlpD